MEYSIIFQKLLDLIEEQRIKQEYQRFSELAGLKASNLHNRYSIQIVIYKPNNLLLEYDQYKQFKKTSNRYLFHPENPSIPVKAHYHIFPSNSKKELYAVNVDDGKAHHRDNRGHIVPKKEADELRLLGVQIPLNNILETKQLIINENDSDIFLTTFIIIDGNNE